MELAVFSECEVAFGASQELSRGFVSASGLNLPNVCGVVVAFWAFNSYGWKSP